MLRSIHLYGAAAQHGSYFLLDVNSPAEAVRALVTIKPDLRRILRDNSWVVYVGDPDKGAFSPPAEMLTMNAGIAPIHIMPAIMAAKKGGIGKIILGVVLIAVSFWNPGGLIAAAGTAGALITTTTVFGFGVSLILGGIGMLLAPTPKGPRAGDGADANERPSFFFNGPTNTSEQGSPVPLVYGRFRVGSIVVNVAVYNEDVVDEESESSTRSLSGMAMRSLPVDAPVPVSTDLVGLAVAKGKGGSGGGYIPKEAPNSLRSRSVVRIHEILSEGPIKGLVCPDMSKWGVAVYFDETPVQADTGEFNFRLISAHFRIGLPVETPIPGFNTAENPIEVGEQVLHGTPVVRRVQSADATSIRVNVRTPSLMKQKNNGDLVPTKVVYQIHYKHGSAPWVLVVEDTFDGKTTSGYERTTQFYLPPRDDDPVDLRVTRITEDAEDLKTRDETWWSSYTEGVEGQFRHDDTASAAFTVNAEHMPTVPKRSFLIDGLLVQIPSNYDPVARTYTGDWDGTFVEDWTNNPAWVLYDLLTSKRGLGRDLPAQYVDKWAFYMAAQYNDELVSDGDGGFEPRFVFNGVLNVQEEAFNVLVVVASSMRAQIYVAGGMVSIAQDRPMPIDRVFSSANVKEGVFEYKSTEQRSRTTAINVRWYDPDQRYEVQFEPVIYADKLGKFGYRENQITATGCTSQGLAQRLGRYFLFSAHHEQETVTFIVSLENADMRPGDLIAIQDARRSGRRWGGRVLEVVAGTPLVLTLDGPVSIMPAGDVMLQQGENLSVLPIVSWVDSRHVQVNPPAWTVEAGAVWLVSSTTLVPTQWRVMSIAERENFEFEVLAARHDPRKYSFVEDNTLLPEPVYDLLPRGALAPPTDLAGMDAYSIDASGAPIAGMLVSWTPSIDPRIVAYQIDAVTDVNRVVRHFAQVIAYAIEFPAETGTWSVSVRGVDQFGRVSASVLTSINLYAIARVPLPPTEFQAGSSGADTLLSWKQPDDISIEYYQIRWTPATEGAKWDGATVVAQYVPRNSVTTVLPFTRSGTYLIKSVSVRGVESETFASSVITDDQIDPYPNAVVHIEQPDWAGTMDGFTVDTTDDELVLDETSGAALPGNPDEFALATPLASAIYTGPILDIGGKFQLTSSAFIQARGVIAEDLMVYWVPLAVAIPLSRTSADDWDAILEERHQIDGVWSSWQASTVAPYIADHVQFRTRAVIYAPGVSVHIDRMEEYIQVLPRTETGQATTTASGVVVVPFNAAFFSTPRVTIQQHGGGSVAFTIQAIDETEFQVFSYNPSTGAAVPSITFDWAAFGYGKAIP